MKLGCIGDDFTGSLDLANVLTKERMRVTQFSGVPFFMPGNAAIGGAIRGLAGKRSAVMLD